MKIQPNWSSIGKNVPKPDSPLSPVVQQKSFSDMLQQQGDQTNQEQLKQLFDKINKQGLQFARSMTVRELRAYKLLVKQFLEETVRRGVGLRDTKGWDRRGRGKRYKLLEEVDAMLLEMAEQLLDHEQGRIQLLDRIGEIRGMLLNVYF
ncbi:MAG: YaaR family protein [Paenibacillaceae bacterium]